MLYPATVASSKNLLNTRRARHIHNVLKAIVDVLLGLQDYLVQIPLWPKTVALVFKVELKLHS
jgi:hypothetical protein